ncbi:MAG: arsenate reductase family protein [Bacilli bacterium]|nr:arsenate reductase family protein [Bacilli bacterium]
MLFIEYPKCSTCKKAKKYLDDKKVSYEDRDIVLSKPTKSELSNWIKMSDKDINSFFNTSGIKYRQLNLKDKLKTMTEDEKIEILSSDGMLVKRPILVLDNHVLVGFKITEWENFL